MKELKEFSSEEEYVPRSIQYIVVHCSATRANIPFTEEQLLKCHLQRGFKCIGYHFYITRDGELHHCRPVSEFYTTRSVNYTQASVSESTNPGALST